MNINRKYFQGRFFGASPSAAAVGAENASKFQVSRGKTAAAGNATTVAPCPNCVKVIIEDLFPGFHLFVE